MAQFLQDDLKKNFICNWIWKKLQIVFWKVFVLIPEHTSYWNKIFQIIPSLQSKTHGISLFVAKKNGDKNCQQKIEKLQSKQKSTKDHESFQKNMPFVQINQDRWANVISVLYRDSKRNRPLLNSSNVKLSFTPECYWLAPFFVLAAQNC